MKFIKLNDGSLVNLDRIHKIKIIDNRIFYCGEESDSDEKFETELEIENRMKELENMLKVCAHYFQERKCGCIYCLNCGIQN